MRRYCNDHGPEKRYQSSKDGNAVSVSLGTMSCSYRRDVVVHHDVVRIEKGTNTNEVLWEGGKQDATRSAITFTNEIVRTIIKNQ
jgi:hypothetical protein